MSPAVINPNDSRIWDEAEVYVLFREDAPNGITPFVPATVEEELDLKWLFTGLLDASAGIPFTPSLEITHYDGFGHPRYRSKAKKGSLDTGFTALEDNSVTRRLVLPGSAPNKIGKPKAVYAYVAYVLRDEDIITQCLISLEPALISVGAFTKGEGAQEMYAFTCAHPNDPNGDVFVRIESDTSGAPTVTSVDPSTIDETGGELVTITGTKFTGATAVTFGGVAASDFEVVSDSKISAITPVTTAGSVAVVVTSPEGASTAVNVTSV